MITDSRGQRRMVSVMIVNIVIAFCPTCIFMFFIYPRLYGIQVLWDLFTALILFQCLGLLRLTAAIVRLATKIVKDDASKKEQLMFELTVGNGLFWAACGCVIGLKVAYNEFMKAPKMFHEAREGIGENPLY